VFFFSSRRRHTRSKRDWSSDVCSSDLDVADGTATDSQTNPDALAIRVAARLQRESLPKLRTVINATGILLHTNLGRAPLAEEAEIGRASCRERGENGEVGGAV